MLALPLDGQRVCAGRGAFSPKTRRPAGQNSHRRQTARGRMKFSAVILAGGKSARMGCDKAFVELDGHTLLARQIQLVRAAGAMEVFISGQPGVNYSEFGCPVLTDRFHDAGPLAGIHSALAATDSLLLLVLAVDLPGMTADFLQKLAAE